MAFLRNICWFACSSNQHIWVVFSFSLYLCIFVYLCDDGRINKKVFSSKRFIELHPRFMLATSHSLLFRDCYRLITQQTPNRIATGHQMCIAGRATQFQLCTMELLYREIRTLPNWRWNEGIILFRQQQMYIIHIGAIACRWCNSFWCSHKWWRTTTLRMKLKMKIRMRVRERGGKKKVIIMAVIITVVIPYFISFIHLFGWRRGFGFIHFNFLFCTHFFQHSNHPL